MESGFPSEADKDAPASGSIIIAGIQLHGLLWELKPHGPSFGPE